MTDMPGNHPVAKHVIIFGDCWPVVSAVKSVITTVLPECHCETVSDLSSLIYRLTCKPEASLLLCLRPGEHIFLLYALKEELICHPTLVISDELFFNDKLILNAWGNIPCMMHQELELMITSQQLCELFPAGTRHCPEKSTLTNFLMAPALPAGFSEVPLIFHLEERLMDYMSLLIYREMLNRGLSPFRIRLLQALYNGHQSYKELAKLMRVTERKIWNEKYRLLAQLDIPFRLRDILYGTRFCLFLQKTPFMPLNEVESIREKARASVPEESPDFSAESAF
ncbi:hypothetical protein C0Z46_23730 [Salmonella enterica]|nr:hypothetical protein [Salmonella enterica]EDB4570051.1 hypothetical protein [Salmonella enterica subsp. enterica serovar Panama]EDN3471472.1 hypothetical protein [Salmonella enterica]EHQ4622308.1 hypothetical protein [Salmonella enterica]EID6667381.1 hypothetical protein [Salmonella enterica]